MEPDPSCVRAGFRNRLYEGNDNTAEASIRRQSGAFGGTLCTPSATLHALLLSAEPANSWMVSNPEVMPPIFRKIQAAAVGRTVGNACPTENYFSSRSQMLR
jgi:hypothetical protein